MADTDSICAPSATKPQLDIDAELAALERLPVGELRERYCEVWGETTRSRHRTYLIRRILWRMQANDEEGLSDRALDRAGELFDPAFARVTPPKTTRTPKPGTKPRKPTKRVAHDDRLPAPGNWVTRQYKGRSIRVLVTTEGFEYDGKRYQSLSAIAKLITGSHMNGFRFFKLGGRK